MKAMLGRMLVFLGAVLAAVSASPPAVMNHQGRILVGGVNFDGSGFFKFALVAGGSGETLWSSDGSGAGEPAGAVEVQVSAGHYSVLLGEAPMPPMPVEVFEFEDDVRLRVWFAEADGGTYTLLAPDRRLTPGGYAFAAGVADRLAPSYESGGGEELQVTGVSDGGGSGVVGVRLAYEQRFGEVPEVELADGWEVTSGDVEGFEAEAAFVVQTLDTAASTGLYASLAVVGGRPAVAYRNDRDGDLMYVRATDRWGEEWLASSVVRVAGAGFGDVGEFASLAVIGGRPAIAFYDAGDGDLKYVRADDKEGLSWPAAVTVDGVGENVGRYVSLAEVGGLPSISYTAPNTGELRYAWAENVEGDGWEVVVIEGDGSDRRQFSALAVLGGKPVVATHNMTDGGVRYLYLSGEDPAEPADWSGVEIDVLPGSGASPSLAVIGGRASLCYEGASGELRFAIADDVSGETWSSSVVVAPNGRRGALAELGGRPAVSYYDPAVGSLVFAWAGDVDGQAWPGVQRIEVDAAGLDVGGESSFAVVGGLPAVAFRDAGGGVLKYASLPPGGWSAAVGGAAPILASVVKAGGVTAEMLAPGVGVWERSGGDLSYFGGRVGMGRVPVANALEVEGEASKTVAGSWLSNSDRRIKKDIRELEGALDRIKAVRLVDFEYTEAYRDRHPSIEEGRRYPNVVAQEFATVFPGWVSRSGERVPGAGSTVWQVDTYPLTIYSAAAIQELADENRQLKKRLERLEEVMAQLLARESAE